MSTEEEPSHRIVDQRIRNRIMEAVETLTMGNEGVLLVWPTEYFEGFYDWIPHGREQHKNSAISDDERAKLSELSKLLDTACDATPQIMTADEFIATGWPERVQPLAKEALSLMLKRGRFSEDHEEQEPSSKGTLP